MMGHRGTDAWQIKRREIETNTGPGKATSVECGISSASPSCTFLLWGPGRLCSVKTAPSRHHEDALRAVIASPALDPLPGVRSGSIGVPYAVSALPASPDRPCSASIRLGTSIKP